MKLPADEPTIPHDVHPAHTPVVPIPQDPFISRPRLRLLQRVVNLMPAAQFFRYLCVGCFNTVFGYITFAIILMFLNKAMPAHFLYLTVVLASIISNPLNITVAYFGYKLFVFRTKGNYLREWLKCFAVYGTSMIPGLIVLSALTRLLQTLIHSHAPALHNLQSSVDTHLNGSPQHIIQHLNGNAMAGYMAGAVVIAFSTIFSFVGHKKVTFKTKLTT